MSTSLHRRIVAAGIADSSGLEVEFRYPETHGPRWAIFAGLGAIVFAVALCI